ncbi:hypothetical protein OKA05_17015 [Luteolibacter arcticus]|uniref:Uncharacterized protein n=1 Tax=Luteolibacter arcticus TaxID=1581411 RepID=A0ABT3GL75_9BACT|nr:hypothetical protein [Luteolibacter arcticus]MCW1924269.1 hypothetical protein [Luteolibacter arcticus]
MILPDTLSPLPVLPRGDDPAGAPRIDIEDFVTAVDVRKVLLGTAGDLPVEGLAAEDFDSFAGRADVPHPACSPFASGRQVELRVPDLAVEPPTIHPAFDILPPTIRRAAPPKVGPTLDCESNFGRGRTGERWWVIGMGLAASAILLSGTLVDFISREAVRRSRAAAPLDVIHVIPGKATPQPGTDPSGTAFAAAVEHEEAE